VTIRSCVGDADLYTHIYIYNRMQPDDIYYDHVYIIIHIFFIYLFINFFFFLFVIRVRFSPRDSSPSRNKTFLHYTHTHTLTHWYTPRRVYIIIYIYSIHGYSPHRGRQRQYIIIYTPQLKLRALAFSTFFFLSLQQRLAHVPVL
jgi:heme/copper-type cytochrome/quinol oxidase subunit 2